MVAAGSGTRLGHGMPKALVPLAGQTLLDHALRGVIDSGVADELVVVLPPGDDRLDRVCRAAADRSGTPVATVPGGAERNDSVRAGLAALGIVDHVLVHDAARCLTPPAVFARIAAALAAGGTAVVPGVPVADTIKAVDPAAAAALDIPDAAVVTGTPDRSGLRAIQTPQGFDAAALAAAHDLAAGWDRAAAAAITDDAGLMERAGHPVLVVPGDPAAFKITTALDLLLAEAVLARQDTTDPHPGALMADRPLIPRTGIGIDVHAVSTDPERGLWLAGLHWPGEAGLSGHSDGDAVAHAACDALFSAAGIGDLGTHFGTDRPEFAGAPGVRLLGEAARLVRAAGWEIGNVAVQFVGRRPKFGPRRTQADAALTAAAGAPVTVTATTSDGLGYEGSGQGITAYATALVYPASANLAG